VAKLHRLLSDYYVPRRWRPKQARAAKSDGKVSDLKLGPFATTVVGLKTSMYRNKSLKFDIRLRPDQPCPSSIVIRSTEAESRRKWRREGYFNEAYLSRREMDSL
jgi:hypothetical protein